MPKCSHWIHGGLELVSTGTAAFARRASCALEVGREARLA